MAILKANSETVTIIRDKLRQVAKESGMTQEEIGVRMGFPKASARQVVSRLLNPEIEYDPRLSTLLLLANALGKSLKDLL
jgi:transcriptional regulator with XRE-family HTH domain